MRHNVNFIGIHPQNSSDWLFFTGENLPKGGLKKFQDELFFQGFQSLKVKIHKAHQISMFGFECVAQIM